MRVLCIGLVVSLFGAARAPAQREPPRSPRAMGVLGAGVLFGASQLAADEVLTADAKAGPALGLGLGFERGQVGLEIRVLAGTREPRVTNAAGDRFPHHAEPPFLWSAGLIGYPLPAFGRGIGRWLRPFGSVGAGGMLTRMDLDNRNGATLYHPWQWNVAGGVRLLTGRESAPAPLVTVLELRVTRYRLLPRGPFRRADLTAVTLGMGLQL